MTFPRFEYLRKGSHERTFGISGSQRYSGNVCHIESVIRVIIYNLLNNYLCENKTSCLILIETAQILI